jgi:DtxR family transcriptional regulator, Mn-dependent transcriptional regulator
MPKTKLKAVTSNREDYLETIYHLESENKIPTTNEIASHLKISHASVSENIKKLAADGLIDHLPYKGVRLTAKGRKLAIDVVRRHRLSERFLTDKLGVKWEEVHPEAHKMEHGISKIVENKMYKMLGKPKTCPHGNPVPDMDGKIREERSIPLSKMEKNDSVRIIKITNEEPKFLCYLATLGLMPRVSMKIEEKAPFSGPIMVKVGRTSYALGRDVAESIWVKKI